jgi:hypothetical protein
VAKERERKTRKEEARAAREAAVRRARRRAMVRRGVIGGLVGLAVAGVIYFLFRAEAPRPIPQAALAAAEAAGCGEVETPASSAPGNLHLASGESYAYDQHPATSGYHDPAPLPAEPHVYTSPVPETQAVHNLEHAYVLVYYRADGDGALPPDAVRALARLSDAEDKVIMAPYPDLPDGSALALAAWNKLWECPSGVTPEQARTIASGFIEAYRGTSNAPEPNAG